MPKKWNPAEAWKGIKSTVTDLNAGLRSIDANPKLRKYSELTKRVNKGIVEGSPFYTKDKYGQGRILNSLAEFSALPEKEQKEFVKEMETFYDFKTKNAKGTKEVLKNRFESFLANRTARDEKDENGFTKKDAAGNTVYRKLPDMTISSYDAMFAAYNDVVNKTKGTQEFGSDVINWMRDNLDFEAFEEADLQSLLKWAFNERLDKGDTGVYKRGGKGRETIDAANLTPALKRKFGKYMY